MSYEAYTCLSLKVSFITCLSNHPQSGPLASQLCIIMDSWKHLQGQFLGSLSQLAESNLRPAATYMERIIPNSIRDQLPALPDSISKFSQVRQTINKHIQKGIYPDLTPSRTI
jgi:hypothetical protein